MIFLSKNEININTGIRIKINLKRLKKVFILDFSDTNYNVIL